MSVRTCLALAILVSGLGAGLRLVLPVSGVDEPFRDVVRFYGAAPQP